MDNSQVVYSLSQIDNRPIVLAGRFYMHTYNSNGRSSQIGFAAKQSQYHNIFKSCLGEETFCEIK